MAEKKITRQHVIAKLLTGAVYFDDEGHWQLLEADKPVLIPYFVDMGVRLEVDTEMGMGFLRPMNQAEEEEFALAGNAPLPKIIPPKTLGYLPSLLCALLREALQRHEETSVDEKHLYQDEGQLVLLLKPYMQDIPDDKALKREVKKVVAKIEEIGVLHRVQNRSDVIYRVEPIVRARIPIAQLQELLNRLKELSKTASTSDEASEKETT